MNTGIAQFTPSTLSEWPGEKDERKIKLVRNALITLNAQRLKRTIDTLRQYLFSRTAVQEVGQLGSLGYRQAISGMSRVICKIDGEMMRERHAHRHREVECLLGKQTLGQ